MLESKKLHLRGLVGQTRGASSTTSKKKQKKEEAKHRVVDVAICILCTGELLCADIWAEYLATARAQGVTLDVYLHVSEGSPTLGAWCEANGVRRTAAVATGWATPAVTTAIMRLFDAALGTGTAEEAARVVKAKKGKAPPHAAHAVLVSQSSIPLIAPKLLAARCAQLGLACAFHSLAADKVSADLRTKYTDAKLLAAHTFCVMSASGWHTIHAAQAPHWEPFCAAHPAAAAHPPTNALAMDEVFLSSMARMHGVPIETSTYLHFTRWNSDASRGDFCDAAFCKASLPRMLAEKRYWFGRKFREQQDDGGGLLVQTALRKAGVLLL